MEPLLKVENLHVRFASYAGNVHAVRGVSFEVGRGEVLAIVGESGCGKTVTAKAAMRLLDRTNAIVDKGSRIELDGQDMLHMPRRKLNTIRGKDISMIFQDSMTSLNPTMTVGKQIMENLLTHTSMTKGAARKRAKELLELVEIPDPEERLDCYPHQLSGGMRQRVMIAMALACRPKILIADEPTTALDVTIQAQILRLMNDLQAEKGTSIIFITHDLGVINEMADDVAVMYCGQVVEKASARVIFTDCKMSHPYTEGLMFSIPRLDNITHKLEPIPGVVPHPLALPKGCKFAPRCKYCTEKCIQEEPALIDVGDGQLIRCFYPNKEERCSEEHKKITVNN